MARSLKAVLLCLNLIISFQFSKLEDNEKLWQLSGCQLIQGMTVNQPAWKVCDQGHVISYPEESTSSDYEEKEADLCLNHSRKHSSSSHFQNKLIWKTKHGKPLVMNLCTLTAVNCRFHVCCCIPMMP